MKRMASVASVIRPTDATLIGYDLAILPNEKRLCLESGGTYIPVRISFHSNFNYLMIFSIVWAVNLFDDLSLFIPFVPDYPRAHTISKSTILHCSGKNTGVSKSTLCQTLFSTFEQSI